VKAATYEWTRGPSRLRFRSSTIFFLLYRAGLARSAHGVAPSQSVPSQE
jgi:hypothetical protein